MMSARRICFELLILFAIASLWSKMSHLAFFSRSFVGKSLHYVNNNSFGFLVDLMHSESDDGVKDQKRKNIRVGVKSSPLGQNQSCCWVAKRRGGEEVLEFDWLESRRLESRLDGSLGVDNQSHRLIVVHEIAIKRHLSEQRTRAKVHFAVIAAIDWRARRKPIYIKGSKKIRWFFRQITLIENGQNGGATFQDRKWVQAMMTTTISESAISELRMQQADPPKVPNWWWQGWKEPFHLFLLGLHVEDHHDHALDHSHIRQSFPLSPWIQEFERVPLIYCSSSFLLSDNFLPSVLWWSPYSFIWFQRSRFVINHLHYDMTWWKKRRTRRRRRRRCQRLLFNSLSFVFTFLLPFAETFE